MSPGQNGQIEYVAMPEDYDRYLPIVNQIIRHLPPNDKFATAIGIGSPCSIPN
ncbi:MAG TPA: hypothetical protein VFY64_06900 [Nitrososphaeraceae archaeon]|nr:hypothetical protein [Nitrososphaeraceae archaeon]